MSTTTPSSPRQTPAIEPPPRIYSVGTLRYTSRGLLILFLWLLWGDFAFCFFENIFSRFLPLYLKDLQASDTLIAIMAGSIAGVVNFFFLPGISKWSDEYRGRWGRRVPFLAVTTPLTVLSVILVGFAPEIGAFFFDRVTSHFLPGLSKVTLILSLLCIFFVAFHYFNMVLCAGFTWLVRDVVPQDWMARFLAWFRIVSTVSSVVFSWYVFPHMMTHRKEICVCIGIFYLITFLAMCWKVQEGEYPPTPPRESEPGMLKSFGLYFRSCFSVRIYRNYFLALMVGGFSSCAVPFYMLFFRDTLKLNMGDMGQIFALGGVVTGLAYLPVGWLCDRFTPIRIGIVAQVGMFLISVASFFLITGKESLIVFTIVGSVISVGWGLGNATLSMRLFPAAKFGQFSSGANIFALGIGVLGNYLAGVFMSSVHSNYRMSYLWSASGGLAIPLLLMVYRDWKRHGGPDNYVAPLPPE